MRTERWRRCAPYAVATTCPEAFMTTPDAAVDAVRPKYVVPGAPGWDQADVAFTDAESAQRWLKSLPLTNVSQLTLALLTQLRAMSALEYPPRERARIAELIREQVAHLHN